MLGLQQAAAFGKRPADVLATVPFVRADGGKEMLHRRLVAGEQLAVEVTGSQSIRTPPRSNTTISRAAFVIGRCTPRSSREA